MQHLFYAEAAKYNVLPIDNRKVARLDVSIRPSLTRGRDTFTLYSDDPIGSSEYNLKLSRRRAESVRAYLTAQFRMIAQDRMVTLWYGDLAPVASNDTEEGRSKNRRVVGVVVGL